MALHPQQGIGVGSTKLLKEMVLLDVAHSQLLVEIDWKSCSFGHPTSYLMNPTHKLAVPTILTIRKF